LVPLTVEGFACQLADVVTAELDAVAPVKTQYRRPSTKSTRWLLPAAVAAKRHRRKLERTWRSTGLDTDRAAYRKCCSGRPTPSSLRHFANILLIPKSAGVLLRTFSTTKLILEPHPAADCAGLCTSFAQFFTDKTASIKHNIAHKLSNLPRLNSLTVLMLEIHLIPFSLLL